MPQDKVENREANKNVEFIIILIINSQLSIVFNFLILMFIKK